MAVSDSFVGYSTFKKPCFFYEVVDFGLDEMEF